MEYDVSLLGGYTDEEEISQDITEMLLVVMQVVKIVTVMNISAMGWTQIEYIMNKDHSYSKHVHNHVTFPQSNKLFMLQGH